MSRVVIYSDEWYPVFSVERVVAEKDESHTWRTVGEIDGRTLRRIERVFREFDEVQAELRTIWDAAYAARQKSSVPKTHPGLVASSAYFSATGLLSTNELKLLNL